MLVTDELAEKLSPVISGGTGSASHLLTMPDFMPDKFEAGTLNLPGIIGLNCALQFIEETGIDKIYAHEQKLTQFFIDQAEALPGVRVVGLPGAEGRVGTVSLDFSSLDNAEAAVLAGCRIRHYDQVRSALCASGSPDTGNLSAGHGTLCVRLCDDGRGSAVCGRKH